MGIFVIGGVSFWIITISHKPIRNITPAKYRCWKGWRLCASAPGMYIGSTGPKGLHHLVYEILDNAIDEALAGYCNKIDVKILPGNVISVYDNGRGIPVIFSLRWAFPAVTVVFTVLHAAASSAAADIK